MKKNNFTVFQEKTKTALYEFNKINSEHSLNLEEHNEYFENLASPFLKGYFTLAVVGKMSAGKSTFINALLGLDVGDALPTGHFQTTCATTHITYADKKSLTITFGDGNTKIYTDDISNKLKEIAAVPEEFNSLPIIEINRLILDDCLDEAILEKKNELAKKANKTKIDEDKLKQYINKYPKEKIATKIQLHYPLPIAFRGWEVVDTPGVGAVGGFGEETKDFLSGKTNKQPNVDAILFLLSAKESIEGSTQNEFVRKTFESISNDAKKRCFFIVTKAMDNDFRREKEDTLVRLKELLEDAGFSDIKEGDRLFCVDSLLGTLYRYLDTKLSVGSLNGETVLDGWDEKTWGRMWDVLKEIKYDLQNKGMEWNNETCKKRINEVSEFNELQKKLNNFVLEEKKSTYTKIIETINYYLADSVEGREKNIDILRRAKEKGWDLKKFEDVIGEELKKLTKLQDDLQEKMGNLRKSFNREAIDDEFEPIRETLDKLPGKTKAEADNKVMNLNNEVVRIYQSFFDKLETEIQEVADQEKKQGETYIGRINIEAIIDKTVKESTEKKDVIERVPRKGFWAKIRRWFGSNSGWEVVKKQKEELNEAKYCKKLSSDLREELIDIRNEIVVQIDEIIKRVDISYKYKISQQQDTLNGLIAKREDLKKEIEINETINTLIQKNKEEVEQYV